MRTNEGGSTRVTDVADHVIQVVEGGGALGDVLRVLVSVDGIDRDELREVEWACTQRQRSRAATTVRDAAHCGIFDLARG